MWDAPEHFLLDRPKAANHLAFGFGPHFSLGAELARSQTRVVLETLFERLPWLRLAGDFQYEPGRRAMHRGLKHVHVCG